MDHFREAGVGKDWVSLPQYFKKNGYLTLGAGKLVRLLAACLPHRLLPGERLRRLPYSLAHTCIALWLVFRLAPATQFHPASATENIGMANNDYPASWTPAYPYFDNQPPDGAHKCLNPVDPGDVSGKGKHTWCAADVAKEASVLSDQKIRDACLAHLRVAANRTRAVAAGGDGAFQRFFVGCGFHKPHVPWVVPTEFFDGAPFPRPPAGEYPLAVDQFAPVAMPMAAWHKPADVGGMAETPAFNGTCNETRARLYRRAYDAAVTYQDYNIGMVLDELETLGLAAMTLVIVFGDHGNSSRTTRARLAHLCRV